MMENDVKLKIYQVFYRDELIAEVTDWGRGFIDFVEDMNPEVTVKDMDTAISDIRNDKRKLINEIYTT